MGALFQDEDVEMEEGWMTIPGLTVHEEVGEGGFGIVYLATQSGRMTRRVALKVLKPGLDTRRILRRFQVEQQALAHLEHPNIARIYDSGETAKGYPYFTMEFIDGVPITEYFKGAEDREILETFLMVCDAVSFAHGKGVVHRDLKPSNILVSAGRVPKIIDFGIAKAVDPLAAPGMSVHTLDDTWLGTPEYMAPEQARDSGMAVDERSDLFSLGKVLQELIPNASSLLKPVLAKATEQNRAARYRTVKDFEADLRLCLDGIKPPRLKVPFLWGLMAGFFLMAGFLLWQGRAPETEEEQKEMAVVFHEVDRGGVMTPLYNRDGSRALVLFRDDGPALLFDPRDGRMIRKLPSRASGIRAAAFSVERDHFILGYYNGRIQWFGSEDGEPTSGLLETSRVKTAAVDQLEDVRIPGYDRPILLTQAGGEASLRAWDRDHHDLWEVKLKSAGWGRAVSPDGRTIVIGSSKGRFTLVDLTRGRKIVEVEKQSGWTTGLRAFQDGSGFLSATSGGTLMSFDWDGNEISSIDSGSRCNDLGMTFDEKTLASAGHDGMARIWDRQSGKLKRELACGGEVWQVVFSPDGRYLATTGKDQAVRVWEVATGKLALDPIEPAQPAFRVSFAVREDGGWNLLVGMSGYGIRIHPLHILSK